MSEQVMLMSSDGQLVSVDEDIARMSVTLKHMLDGKRGKGGGVKKREKWGGGGVMWIESYGSFGC